MPAKECGFNLRRIFKIKSVPVFASDVASGSAGFSKLRIPHFPLSETKIWVYLFRGFGAAMMLVVMNIAKSYKIIDCVLSFVAVMLLMMELKHFSGIIW